MEITSRHTISWASSSLQYIALHYLALQVNLYPVYLCRAFSKYYGCNLGVYLRKLRLTKALALMADQKPSLTDIAFEVGYADQSHFIRSFKNQFDVAPHRFRGLCFHHPAEG